jgi:hypothetical protein
MFRNLTKTLQSMTQRLDSAVARQPVGRERHIATDNFVCEPHEQQCLLYFHDDKPAAPLLAWTHP